VFGDVPCKQCCIGGGYEAVAVNIAYDEVWWGWCPVGVQGGVGGYGLFVMPLCGGVVWVFVPSGEAVALAVECGGRTYFTEHFKIKAQTVYNQRKYSLTNGRRNIYFPFVGL